MASTSSTFAPPLFRALAPRAPRAARGAHASSPPLASSRRVPIATSSSLAATTDASASPAPAPYAGFVPPEVRPEVIVKMPSPGAVEDIDERIWVPQTADVSFRPLLLNVTQGYYVNLLRVRGSGVLSRHRHPGPVHGWVIKGRWSYLEHDWVAEEGSYVFEPPGETHTLVVPEGVDEMITLFNVTGPLMYCDEEGNVTKAEDVFDKLALAKAHYEKVGLGADYVDQFVR